MGVEVSPFLHPLPPMLWCEFRSRLKKLNPRLWVHINNNATHPQFPWIRICGIYYDKVHLCSCTYDSIVPLKSTYDSEDVLINQGLEDIFKNMLRATKKGDYSLRPIIKKSDIQKYFGINAHRIETDR